MTLPDTIDAFLEEHCETLINGYYSRASEIIWWITLLNSTNNLTAPVRNARIYGFTFIRCRADVTNTIQHLLAILRKEVHLENI